MFKILQSVIHAGNFKLADMRYKVNKLYVQGELTEEQADQLLAQAEQGATPDAERPELLQIVRNLSAKVDALAAEVAALKTGTGTPEPDTGATEYEPWTPWDGISDKYQPGAIVLHNGKTWMSTYTGQTVWEPGVVGNQFWVEYKEDQYDDHEESGLLEED